MCNIIIKVASSCAGARTHAVAGRDEREEETVIIVAASDAAAAAAAEQDY